MEGKMKAAVLHGINDLRIEEVEIPRLDEHDVSVSYTHLTLPTIYSV